VVEKVYALIVEIGAVKDGWWLTGQLQPQTIERLTLLMLVTTAGTSWGTGSERGRQQGIGWGVGNVA
jgi:hypothetical protein